MKDLKQQVSLYFGIPSGTKVILQRFDKEWHTYLDLDEADTFHITIAGTSQTVDMPSFDDDYNLTEETVEYKIKSIHFFITTI